MARYGKIAIIGVGLIGGSIGLALKRKRLVREVVGVGHHKSSIRKAVRHKTIDWGTLNFKRGVEDADIVIMATPVLTIGRLVKKIIPYLKKGSIITDVGSTKLKLTKAIEESLPRGIYFVGGHPMAGSEKRGVEKAKVDLFKESICILTKTKNTDTKSLERIKTLWQTLGARVVVLSPKAHDRIVSQISHLPHMLIFSMLNGIDKKDLVFASSGFYDATRIASSDARIWRDIAVSNKDEIMRSIAKFKKELSVLERAIMKKESKTLLRMFENAKAKRESI